MAGIIDTSKKGWKTQLIRELHVVNPTWTPSMIQREIESQYPGHTVTLPTISYALKEKEVDNMGSGVTPEFQQSHQPITIPIAAAVPVPTSIPVPTAAPPRPIEADRKVEEVSFASVKQMMEVHRWLLKRDLLPSHIIELLRMVPSAKMLMEIMTAFDELEGK